MMFQSSRDTKTCLYGYPKVQITEEAADDMWHIVDECPTEVGWMMRADIKHEGDNTIIVLDKVYLLHQTAHATTTELTEEGLAKLAEELLAQQNGVDEWNKVRAWFHSHVNMGVSPSGQDNTQMQTFKNAGHDWMLRGIANKKGEIQFDFYLYKYGIHVESIPWTVVRKEVNSERRTFWKGVLGERVKPHVEAWQKGAAGGTAGGTASSYHEGYPSGGYGSLYRGGGVPGNYPRRRKLSEKFKGNIFGAIASNGDIPGNVPTTDTPVTPATPGQPRDDLTPVQQPQGYDGYFSE